MVNIRFGEVKITNPNEANVITKMGAVKGYNVYSTALLALVFPEIRVARVENLKGIEIGPDVIVYDVGDVCDPERNRFDYNPDGNILKRKKSFLLLWERYGEEILNKIGVERKYLKEVWEKFRRSFVVPIDLDWTHVRGSSPQIMYMFNPEFFDDFSYDQAFFRALEYAKVAMTNALKRVIYDISVLDTPIITETKLGVLGIRNRISQSLNKLEHSKVIITKPEEANVITSAGVFYGINVFSTALMTLVMPQVRLARINDLFSVDRDALIFDCDTTNMFEKKSQFHTYGFTRVRSFGILWEQYGEEILTRMKLDKKYIQSVYGRIENGLVKQVDENDWHSRNICREMFDFNPLALSSSNDAFLEAVGQALIVLKNKIRVEIGFETQSDFIEEQINKANRGILDPKCFAPLQQDIFTRSQNPKRNEIYLIVYPYVTGDWWVEKTRSAYDDKIYFPNEWKGKRGDQFAKLTGVEDATYCESFGQYCRARTHQGAIRLAQLALEYNRVTQ